MVFEKNECLQIEASEGRMTALQVTQKWQVFVTKQSRVLCCALPMTPSFVQLRHCLALSQLPYKTLSTCRRLNSHFVHRKMKTLDTIKPVLVPSHLRKFLTGHISKKTLSPVAGYITRDYHSGTEFTLANPVFHSYVQSLVDEYTSLMSSRETRTGQGLDRETQERTHFLESVAHTAQQLNEKYNDLQELTELAKGEDCPEMMSLIDKDVALLKADIEQIEIEMVNVLGGEEVADKNDIILEVSAGVGGQEAMLFAADIFNMYLGYARYQNWAVGAVEHVTSEIGGVRKASAEIRGENVYQHLKHEAGVHRVQRVPKTESKGRIHTSTVSVSVLPQPSEVDMEIDPKELKIETMRSSGPGGQAVNTADSAVRITHLPTGTVCECQQERSQHKNKETALQRLKSKLYQEKVEKMENERRAARKMQVGTKGRSEKIRTYNFQQARISDHRVKQNIYDVHGFLQGESMLEDLIRVLELDSKREMLESMLDNYQLSSEK